MEAPNPRRDTSIPSVSAGLGCADYLLGEVDPMDSLGDVGSASGQPAGDGGRAQEGRQTRHLDREEGQTGVREV